MTGFSLILSSCTVEKEGSCSLSLTWSPPIWMTSTTRNKLILIGVYVLSCSRCVHLCVGYRRSLTLPNTYHLQDFPLMLGANCKEEPGSASKSSEIVELDEALWTNSSHRPRNKQASGCTGFSLSGQRLGHLGLREETPLAATSAQSNVVQAY